MGRRFDPSENISYAVAKLLWDSAAFQSGGWEVYGSVPFWCLEVTAASQLHAPYTGTSQNAGVLDMVFCRQGYAVLGVSFSQKFDVPNLELLTFPVPWWGTLRRAPERIPKAMEDLDSFAAAIEAALGALSHRPSALPLRPWDGSPFLADGKAAEARLQQLHLLDSGVPTKFGVACGIFTQHRPDGPHWVFHQPCRSMVLSMLLGLGRESRPETIPYAVRKARLEAGWPTDTLARAGLSRCYGELLQLNINQLTARHKDADAEKLSGAVQGGLAALSLPEPTLPTTYWDILNLLHQLHQHYKGGDEDIQFSLHWILENLLYCFLPLYANASGRTFSYKPEEPPMPKPEPLPDDGPVPLEERLRRFHREAGLIKQFSDLPIVSYFSALSAYTSTLYPMWLMQAEIYRNPIHRKITMGVVAIAANQTIQEELGDLMFDPDIMKEPLKALPSGYQMAYDLLVEPLFPSPKRFV